MQPKEKEKKNSADKQRTIQQNKALHLYLSQVANELDRQGHTMQNVVQKITKVEIKPTLYNVKEMIWREIQKAVLGKDSTTFLEKNELDQVYDVMNKWLGTYFEIYIPFPNDEQRQWEKVNYSDYKKD